MVQCWGYIGVRIRIRLVSNLKSKSEKIKSEKLRKYKKKIFIVKYATTW